MSRKPKINRQEEEVPGLSKEIQNRRGEKILPVLCHMIGTVILAAVILFGLLLTAPRFLGYEVYNVVSGSMEPEIPVGSLIYVEAAKPEQIQTGDIIAFYQENEESVVVHRVLQNQTVEGELTTKGDANDQEDVNAVPYAAVIGKVVRHFPALGTFSVVLTSTAGKIYLLCFAACGVMFNLLAGRLRRKRKEDETK